MIPILLLLKSNINLETIIIAFFGYIIVFFALVLLNWLFNFTPKLIYYKRGKSSGTGQSVNSTEKYKISGEETAAIAMALHLYLAELHDEESGILTIKKISKSYSPWSSKIYGVQNKINRI